MPASGSLLGLIAALVTAVAAPVNAAQYVAMGSSFAAGPGILPMVPASPARCARSTENYAHVLAGLRHLSLLDVSCSGATTADVIKGGRFSLPPQLDAVTADTQLITVTIGGNDVFFMANLMAMACAPTRVCQIRPDALVSERFASLADSLRQIVAGAHQRSPKARVVFVNYFSVLPEHGTCARVGLTPEQADQMRAVAAHLADVTGQVATATGSGLFNLASLSSSHSACAQDPWVFGAHPDPGEPAFHPNREAMRAVGEALNSYLERAR